MVVNYANLAKGVASNLVVSSKSDRSDTTAEIGSLTDNEDLVA